MSDWIQQGIAALEHMKGETRTDAHRQAAEVESAGHVHRAAAPLGSRPPRNGKESERTNERTNERKARATLAEPP
jgi:hypothetical protein